jgi:ABC-2 type transport system ATP-binding protein
MSHHLVSARRRRGTVAAAAVTTTAAALATLTAVTPGASAADSTPGYSMKSIEVDVKVGPANDKSCTISADLYTPDGVDARHKAPAILTTHGFGGNKADSNQEAAAHGFVGEGYVVLSYTGLGFGDSDCPIYLDDPDYDGKAGKQMVSVLAGKKDYRREGSTQTHRIKYVAKEAPGDPRVGMVGGSYGGQIQYAVAMQDKRVDALIPIITWNDLQYSLAPNNTALRGVHPTQVGVTKKDWTNLFFGVGIEDGIQDADVNGDPASSACGGNFEPQVCPAAAQLDTAGYPDANTKQVARQSSVSSYMDRITAPTLLVQGQADTLFNLQEATATYRSLRAQGTPVRMIWQSWGHSDSSPQPGELDLGADSIRDTYLGRRFLAWMDHWVRGDDTAPTGPNFSYFQDWVDYDTSPAAAGQAVTAAYATRSTLPGLSHTLYFSGKDPQYRLVKRAGLVVKGQQSYGNTSEAPTSYSETSGVEGSTVNKDPEDGPGTFAAWTTRPLTRHADWVGSGRLLLHLDAPVAAGSQAHPAGRLVLFAKVYDVAPDGTFTLTHRLISPVRVPDVTKPLRIELPGIVHRFATGHKIRVVLAASDAAYANNHLAQPVTVSTSPRHPSVLRLPLTSDLRVKRP